MQSKVPGSGSKESWKSDLSSLLAPASIAIVGASERSHIASGTFRNLEKIGFAGRLYPVNPKYKELHGQPCYPTLLEVPETVDLAVIIVPALSVPVVLKQCGERTIPSAVIMATGFAEAGEEGLRLSQEVRQVAEEYEVRVCGPGSFGVLSSHDRAAAYMARMSSPPLPGNVAVVTQSGSLLNLLLTVGQERGIGFSYLVSAGSEAVLTATDYLAFFLNDEKTHLVAMVIEQFRDPQALLALGERAAELGKPLLVLKVGSSERGRKVSQAHSGALAGSDEFHEAVFRKLGILRVGNLDELIEAMVLMSSCRLPSGKGLGVVSVSGGDCVLATDLAEKVGLVLPDLAEKTQRKIASLLPESGITSNPLDTGMRPLWEKGLFGKAIAAMADDPAISIVAVRLNAGLGLFAGMGEVARSCGKPVIAFTRASQSLAGEFYRLSREISIPILHEVQKSFQAIRCLVDYAEFRRAKKQTKNAPSRPKIDGNRIVELVNTERTVLTEFESKRFLKEFGFSTTREILAENAEESVTAAQSIGYPVAVKVMSPDIVHKTEAGALCLDLKSDNEVREAFIRVLEAVKKANSAAKIDGVLVQEMVPRGVGEVFLGMVSDSGFGPGVLFGLGGTYVEVFKHSVLRLPPVSYPEALSMIDEIKGVQLLKGYRGRPAADIESLARTIELFSQLCLVLAEVVESIDLNPIILKEKGRGLKVVDATIIRRDRP